MGIWPHLEVWVIQDGLITFLNNSQWIRFGTKKACSPPSMAGLLTVDASEEG
jgi:hypothetical protein